jgi:hypothetical protein
MQKKKKESRREIEKWKLIEKERERKGRKKKKRKKNGDID